MARSGNNVPIIDRRPANDLNATNFLAGADCGH
jgi:hypothetical protein